MSHISLSSLFLCPAPCLPENVVAELNCNSNVLSVQWQQTPGDADDTYTALAIGNDGYQASCNSTSTSCSISNLQCGQTYEVAVTSSSINCSIIAGSDYRVQSGTWALFSNIHNST